MRRKRALCNTNPEDEGHIKSNHDLPLSSNAKVSGSVDAEKVIKRKLIKQIRAKNKDQQTANVQAKRQCATVVNRDQAENQLFNFEKFGNDKPAIDINDLLEFSHTYVNVDHNELETASDNIDQQLHSVKYYGQVSKQLPFERFYQHTHGNGKFDEDKHRMLIVTRHNTGFERYPHDKTFASLVHEYFLQEIHEREQCFDPAQLALAGHNNNYSERLFEQFVKKDREIYNNSKYNEVRQALLSALKKKDYVVKEPYKCPDPECCKCFSRKETLMNHVIKEHLD